MDVSETKNMDLFSKVRIFELLKTYAYELFFSLISLISVMVNYVKLRIVTVTVVRKSYGVGLNKERKDYTFKSPLLCCGYNTEL